MMVTHRVRELWRFREVIRNFVAQDLKVKYRRSALGFLWSLLNPLLMMGVLTVVFATVFDFRGGVDNYTLYLLSGILPWTFFAATVDGSGQSILSNESYLKRQYFPKLVFPLSVVGQHLVTLILSMIVLLSVMGWFIGFRLSAPLLSLPLSFIILIATALGLGMVVAVVTVYYRDVQHLVQVALQAWYFLTPIIWPIKAKENTPYGYLFKLNPTFSLMELFHKPIHEAQWPDSTAWITSSVFAGICLLTGLVVFWSREDELIYRL